MNKISDLLQKKLSEKRYFDICDFVEELYCMEYDLLILMARKFFNLFCIFHELNCEKYRQLNIPYKRSGKIITNRALPLYKASIENDEYKKIVIADDIIIHGRSIREIYDEIIDLCPDVYLKMVSYMRNDKDISVYKDILEDIKSRYVVEPEEWREMSDEIVRIFYASGRPYLSYLPYFTINITWENLMKRLDSAKCYSIINDDMKYYDIDALAYMGSEFNVFQEMKSCKICTMRIYHYKLIDKIILVPYFCMGALEKNALVSFSDEVRKKFFTKEYRELLGKNEMADEMRVIELEYTISTWMAMSFSDYHDIPIEWHRDIEQYNFGEKVLFKEKYSLDNILENIKSLYNQDEKLEVMESIITPETRVLKDCYDKLKEKYSRYYNEWKSKRQWEDLCKDYIQRFIEELLSVNGRIDEDACEKDSVQKKRLYGIPISYIVDDLGKYFAEFKDNFGDVKKCKERVFASLITAIDSGKGTIINRIVSNDQSKEFYESLIYAGEQNYKFYENTNFPVMYGLYLIEQKYDVNSDILKEKKNEFVKVFSEYLEKNSIFYTKEEMQQIMDVDISPNFGRFLHNSYKKHRENQVLQEAINIAMSIE